MTQRFSKGDYTAQIFAYERDSIRLLHEVQQYVAAGKALYGAVSFAVTAGGHLRSRNRPSSQHHRQFPAHKPVAIQASTWIRPLSYAGNLH
jgi:hypothetical protein